MAGYIANSEDLGYAHDYTGIHFHRIRFNKRVRKDHVCLICQRTITTGSPSVRHAGLEMGRFYNYHECVACYEVPPEAVPCVNGFTGT
ncbi:hypothetical protein [Tumebacillus permanentifrigoris]|uniref:Uncharacterized protein n=1 Tax=Tumebacillus permanentifrigoris TaxID=378543 RepID=A0A316DQ29_9BACL|nr:hypothetical protein [Tumebacillus permanentifrigoris]PWK05266.1 hypothetical protein C7459_12415 [Tumebacillus permanentifrigoris]